jgi:endogenous inhibitor of DNA gyrase (YacG/DUF329 family)
MFFKCPICRKRFDAPVEDPKVRPPYYPFCSDRCKLVDLGAWLNADYRLDSDTPDLSEEGN